METSEFTSEARWFTIHSCNPFRRGLSSVRSNLPAREKKSRFLRRLFPRIIFYVDYRGATFPQFRGEWKNSKYSDRIPSRKLRSLINDGEQRAPGECFPRGEGELSLRSLANNFKYLSICEYLGFRNEENLKIEGGREDWLIGKRTRYLISKREKDYVWKVFF